jgi:hypothetical protein
MIIERAGAGEWGRETPQAFSVQVQRLRTILRVAQGATSFIFVVCNTSRSRGALISALEDDLGDVLSVEVRVGQLDPYEAANTIAGDQQPPVVLVFGLGETLLDHELGRVALAALNASRELWWSRFACPVVFFLSDAALDKMALGAPDLWSRRSHVLRFPDPEPVHQSPAFSSILAHTPASALFDDIQRWPVARREARLVELQARLGREPASGPPDTQRRRLRWLLELGLLHYAMQRREVAQAALLEARNAAEIAADSQSYDAITRWLAVIMAEQLQRKAPVATAEAAPQARVTFSTLLDSTKYSQMVLRAQLLYAQGEATKAESLLTEAIAWGESRQPRNERALADWRSSRALVRAELGDHVGAEADLQQLIDWGERQSPRDERGLARYLAIRADIRKARGDLAGAEADIQHAIDWGERQTPRDEVELEFNYTIRAIIRQARGDLAGAEADMQRLIDRSERQPVRNERSLATKYALRSGIREDRGDLIGAESDIQKSIEYSENLSPRDDKVLAIRYASRADLRDARGDIAGAEADILRAIDLAERQTSPDEISLAHMYEFLALIHVESSRMMDAQTAIDRSVELHTKVFGLDHERTLATIKRRQAIQAGKVPD